MSWRPCPPAFVLVIAFNATVGLGYEPVRLPPAVPKGILESVRRKSLPCTTTPEVASPLVASSAAPFTVVEALGMLKSIFLLATSATIVILLESGFNFLNWRSVPILASKTPSPDVPTFEAVLASPPPAPPMLPASPILDQKPLWCLRRLQRVQTPPLSCSSSIKVPQAEHLITVLLMLLCRSITVYIHSDCVVIKSSSASAYYPFIPDGLMLGKRYVRRSQTCSIGYSSIGESNASRRRRFICHRLLGCVQCGST